MMTILEILTVLREIALSLLVENQHTNQQDEAPSTTASNNPFETRKQDMPTLLLMWLCHK